MSECFRRKVHERKRDMGIRTVQVYPTAFFIKRVYLQPDKTQSRKQSTQRPPFPSLLYNPLPLPPSLFTPSSPLSPPSSTQTANSNRHHRTTITPFMPAIQTVKRIVHVLHVQDPAAPAADDVVERVLYRTMMRLACICAYRRCWWEGADGGGVVGGGILGREGSGRWCGGGGYVGCVFAAWAGH